MKFIDIAIKDLKQGFRSWVALGFMFGAPILMTAMFYVLFGGLGGGEEEAFEVPITTVQLVNLDKSDLRLGDTLIDALHSEGFAELLDVTLAQDADSARQAVDSQAAAVAVIIPENFSDAVIKPGGRTEIEFYKDPTLILGPNIVTSIVNQFTDNFSGSKITLSVAARQFQGAGLAFTEEEVNLIINDYIQAAMTLSGGEGLVAVESATGETAQAGSTVSMVSMIMGAMMIFYSFYTGISNLQGILREEENGTMPRLFTTPTPQSTILAGKFLATGIMVFVQLVVLITFGNLVFRVEWGDLFLLSTVILGITAASSTFGIFLISFITKSSQVGAIIGGGMTTTGMIGMIPVFTMNVSNAPKSVEVISKLVPQGWAVDALRTVMEGGASQNVLLSVGVLLIWSAVFFMIGNARFKRRYV